MTPGSHRRTLWQDSKRLMLSLLLISNLAQAGMPAVAPPSLQIADAQSHAAETSHSDEESPVNPAPLPSALGLNRELIVISPIRFDSRIPEEVRRYVEGTLTSPLPRELGQTIQQRSRPLGQTKDLEHDLSRVAREQRAGYALTAAVEASNQGFRYRFVAVDAKRTSTMVAESGDVRDMLLLKYSLENHAFRFAQIWKQDQLRKNRERQKGIGLAVTGILVAAVANRYAELQINEYEDLGPREEPKLYDQTYQDAVRADIIRWVAVGAGAASVGTGLWFYLKW